MTEGNPRPRVPEQAARPSGRKDYPAKRTTVSARPVTPPDGGTPATIDPTVSRQPMSPDELNQARADYIDIIAQARRESGIFNIDMELAESTRVDPSVFGDFKRGLTTTPDLGTIISALLLKRYVTPDDPRIERLRALWERYSPPDPQKPEESRETVPSEPNDVRWLRTLTRRGMTLKHAIRYIRLSKGLSTTKFAEKAKIGTTSLEEYESGKGKPTPVSLDSIIQFAELDPDGKPAQLLRLQAADQAVWSVDQLETCTFGKLMRYLYTQRSATTTKLAVDLGYSAKSSFISSVATDKEGFTISDRSVETFITWLGLPPNSALAGVIRTKHRNTDAPISVEVLQDVLGDKYLFKEHLSPESIPQYPLATSDQELLTELEERMTLGDKVNLLMEKGSMNEKMRDDFWGSKKNFQNYIKQLGSARGYEFNLARLLMVYGYDINHPITWHFLETLKPLQPSQE